MVVWNAPQDVADHAYQTVEAAIQMNEYLAYMEPIWSGLGYPPINIRSGIHTATVFVGNIGSPDRMKYGTLKIEKLKCSKLCTILVVIIVKIIFIRSFLF